MLTAAVLLMIIYWCRRPLVRVGAYLLAFVIGFTMGWEFMRRR